ncbi:hemagglutinin [Parathermosynechococcus lividus]|nr:hemagglutinin [Synechococcus sp. PCC 6716]
MSEQITASEAKQIMDILKELHGDMKAVKSELQALTMEVKVNQTKNDEQFKALNEKVEELRDRQRATDNRLWSFIVALILLLAGGLVKLTLFDKI